METFISAIRSTGSFNNNPNAKQLQSAYKRLPIKYEVKDFENVNCLSDAIDILHATSKKENCTDPLYDYSEHMHFLEGMWQLSPFVDEVMQYIDGYVVRKLFSKIFVLYALQQ